MEPLHDLFAPLHKLADNYGYGNMFLMTFLAVLGTWKVVQLWFKHKPSSLLELEGYFGEIKKALESNARDIAFLLTRAQNTEPKKLKQIAEWSLPMKSRRARYLVFFRTNKPETPNQAANRIATDVKQAVRQYFGGSSNFDKLPAAPLNQLPESLAYDLAWAIRGIDPQQLDAKNLTLTLLDLVPQGRKSRSNRATALRVVQVLRNGIADLASSASATREAALEAAVSMGHQSLQTSRPDAGAKATGAKATSPSSKAPLSDFARFERPGQQLVDADNSHS